MRSATLGTTAANGRMGLADKAVDVYTQVAHEAGRLKSLAAEAVDDSTYAAKRALKLARRRAQAAADLRDEAMHRVKREPLKAMGVAFGVGLFAGALVAWACMPRRAHRATD